MPTAVTRLVGDRYRLRERLGAGGVGEVWRAEDTVLDRPVALKLLRPEHADSEEYRERLRLEGRHLAALSHPRLAEVYDYGDGAGTERPYLVMELIEGEPLSALLARAGTLPPRRVLEIVAQAADGLSCAHGAGLVHRDMKPANLLVRPDGSIKITDFGIARGPETLRLTRTGQVIGTPLYLSPEQAAGRGVTPACDLYSLGVIAWECLAGRPPFDGDDVLAVAIAHRDRPVPPLPRQVPLPVRALVQALTAKEPAARPDAAEVIEQARRLLDDPEVTAAPSGPMLPPEDTARPPQDTASDAVLPPEAQARPDRRSLLFGVGAAAFAALAGATGWALGSPSDETVSSVRASVGRPSTPTARQVTLDPTRYYGRPISAVAAALHRLGLRVSVRYQDVPERSPGTVVGVAPSGAVSVGTTVTVFVARTARTRSQPPGDADRPGDPVPRPATPVSRPGSMPRQAGGSGAGPRADGGEHGHETRRVEKAGEGTAEADRAGKERPRPAGRARATDPPAPLIAGADVRGWDGDPGDGRCGIRRTPGPPERSGCR